MHKISLQQQKQIYKQIHQGYAAKDIAENLGLSTNTIYIYARQYEVHYKALLLNGKYLKRFGVRKNFK
jgi:uncharacterized protein YjcR